MLENKYVRYAIVAIILIIGIVSAVAITNKLNNDDAVVWTDENANVSNENKDVDNKDVNSKELDNKEIYVHITGAVKTPGVYKFKGDKKVFDAIKAAGGTAVKADVDQINLVENLVDGEKIVVPYIGEVSETNDINKKDVANNTKVTTHTSKSKPTNTLHSGSKVNINRASLAELDALPGVGPSTAQKIIDYRKSNGPFKSYEDVLNVSGIGPKKLEAMKDYLSF